VLHGIFFVLQSASKRKKTSIGEEQEKFYKVFEMNLDGIAKNITEKIYLKIVEKSVTLTSRRDKYSVRLGTESQNENPENNIEFDVKFIKKDISRQLAYGVVMSPNLFDKDADIVLKADVISDASHEWLENSREMNVYHKQPLEYWQSSPVESYMTAFDMVVKGDDFVPCSVFRNQENGKEILSIYTIEPVDITKEENKDSLPFKMVLYLKGELNKNTGDYLTKDSQAVEYVPKDSWFMVVHAADKKLWKMIEDCEIVGFSIEGTGKKKEIEI